jgi:outer membrane lipoprotein-sorting protein
MTPRRPAEDDELRSDVLDRSLAELRAAPVPDGPPPGVVAATLAALQAASPDRPPLQLQRNKLMRHLTRLAAALILIAGTAALLFLAGKTSSVALADVVQKVRDARALTYTLTSTSEETGVSRQVKYFQLGDGRRRTEFSAGMISIVDPRAGKTLMLHPLGKIAFVDAFRVPPGDPGFDPVEQLKNLRAAGAKDLGVHERGGRKLHGFVSTTQTPELTLWADAQTGLPVSAEFTSPVAGGWSKVVMSDFVLDPKLDESLFSLDVPAGYEVSKATPRRAATAVAQQLDPERHVVEALRGYARLADGKFPAKFNDWGDYAVRQSQSDDADPQLMGHLGALTPFLISLPRDAWAYTGAGKTLAVKDALIFWYRKPDNTHRALYGDLTFRTVKPEELPPAAKAPNPNPK